MFGVFAYLNDSLAVAGRFILGGKVGGQRLLICFSLRQSDKLAPKQLQGLLLHRVLLSGQPVIHPLTLTPPLDPAGSAQGGEMA